MGKLHPGHHARPGVTCAAGGDRPQGHESAPHFRAYTGEIAVNTPMSDARPVACPSRIRIASEHASSGVV